MLTHARLLGSSAHATLQKRLRQLQGAVCLPTVVRHQWPEDSVEARFKDPNYHRNRRILQTMVSGIPLVLGTRTKM